MNTAFVKMANGNKIKFTYKTDKEAHKFLDVIDKMFGFVSIIIGADNLAPHNNPNDYLALN